MKPMRLFFLYLYNTARRRNSFDTFPDITCTVAESYDCVSSGFILRDHVEINVCRVSPNAYTLILIGYSNHYITPPVLQRLQRRHRYYWQNYRGIIMSCVSYVLFRCFLNRLRSRSVRTIPLGQWLQEIPMKITTFRTTNSSTAHINNFIDIFLVYFRVFLR